MTHFIDGICLSLQMMDLSIVNCKLERGKYKTVADCVADIRLVWTNFKKYNFDGSDFYLHQNFSVFLLT